MNLEQLVGTWTLLSWEQKKRDGTKIQRYGVNPTGIAFFDAGGRYIIAVMRSDRAKYASNALWQGTAEENKETVDGTITYFGTYSASEKDRCETSHPRRDFSQHQALRNSSSMASRRPMSLEYSAIGWGRPTR
jgi:hypothetical protein